MNYGFLIRNDRCIGCHACSTACKSENEVPLGVNRTWVKSVETGAYPNVRRHFQVTRCNHCANPPCVRICPVTAMYQRDDGIVEFDPDVCIGCKACLQACPYDAIYIDPESGTAAKCHYCAHRIELSLEPACVVVCPEHAIIAGDLDDPLSEISQMVAANHVTVRKPEQGTAPKLFYVDGNEANLTPTAVERTPVTFAWSDVTPLHAGGGQGGDGVLHRQDGGPRREDGERHGGVRDPQHEKPAAKVPRKLSSSGASLRSGQPQGVPTAGPIIIGHGRMAEQMIQVTYNAQHKLPWHWPVPAYLVTKGLAAGLFLIVSISYGLGLIRFDATSFAASGLVAVFFTLITTGLLVYDLERPERFLRIVLRPQWRSWLVRGAYLLIGFATVATVWLVLEAGAVFDMLPSSVAAAARKPLLWIGLPLAVGTATYTAFLFGQAEGRDLWQSSLLPVHMLIQSLVAGSSAVMLMGIAFDLSADLLGTSGGVFLGALILDFAMLVAGEFGMPHASEAAATAAHEIGSGRYRRIYRVGVLAVGHLLPVGLWLIGGPIPLAIAAAAALIGLYLYEYVFVMAPQEVPNS